MTGDEVTLMRVPISLPCQVPVLPGTPVTDAPIEERTERCAVDAFWMVGRAMCCTLHLRTIFGDAYVDDLIDGQELSDRETVPWEQMHRYEQVQAVPEWER